MMFEAEIAQGMKLLDQHEPGWRQRIDVDRLDMLWAVPCVRQHNSGRCCIGAQLADSTDGESYYEWAEWFSGLNSGSDAFHDWAYRHGFEAPSGHYPALTKAWRHALRQDGGGA